MADNKKQLSDITIAHSNGQTTAAHFAADIDNFMVYDNNGAANSVKDLVFGDTNPGTFESIKDETGKTTADNSMWGQLNTKAQECYDILDKNKNFWSGLSQASYAETINGDYLASGAEVKKVNFYGDDVITAEADRKKLVSLGALEDFAQRVPTMGNPNNLAEGNGVAFGNKAKAASNSFAFSGDAEGSNTVSFHSQTNQANNIIAFHSEVDSNGAVALDGQVWGEDGIAIKGIVEEAGGIAIGPGTKAFVENQTVIGHFNANDSGADVIIGIGTSATARKNGLMIKDGVLMLPKKIIYGNPTSTFLSVNSKDVLPDGVLKATYHLCALGAETGDTYGILWDVNVLRGKAETIENKIELLETNAGTWRNIICTLDYDGCNTITLTASQGGFTPVLSGSSGYPEKISWNLISKEICMIDFF